MGYNFSRYTRAITVGSRIATGQPLSHEPFVRYITAKFSDIYEL